MGISTLLRTLRSITTPVNLREYSGQTAAVDALCWLHRGTYNCATELCLGQKTDRYIRFCMDRVQMLLDNNITPILVFDGADLPAKEGTNDNRHDHREESKRKGLEYYKNGNMKEASFYFRQAIDITPEMYIGLLKELKKRHIQYIIAPYEADAQLGYLSRENIVDVVITEDSDSLPYGCKKILYKLERTGYGEEIRLSNLGANEEIRFIEWTQDMFLYMCILSGCDYLPSLPSMGIKTAHKYVSRGRIASKIFELMKLDGFNISKEYEEGFLRAVITFRHQTVYDPRSHCTVPLLPYTRNIVSPPDYIGPLLPPDIAEGVATARLHPWTHQPFLITEKEEEENISNNGYISKQIKGTMQNSSSKNSSLHSYFTTTKNNMNNINNNNINNNNMNNMNNQNKKYPHSLNSRGYSMNSLSSLRSSLLKTKEPIIDQSPLSVQSDSSTKDTQSQEDSQETQPIPYISLSKYFTSPSASPSPSLSVTRSSSDTQPALTTAFSSLHLHSQTKRSLSDITPPPDSIPSQRTSQEQEYPSHSISTTSTSSHSHGNPSSTPIPIGLSSSSYTSPLVNTSFKPLLETPSQRGINVTADLTKLDQLKFTGFKNISASSASTKPIDLVPESPPRKHVNPSRCVIIRESPVSLKRKTHITDDLFHRDAHTSPRNSVPLTSSIDIETRESEDSDNKQEEDQFLFTPSEDGCSPKNSIPQPDFGQFIQEFKRHIKDHDTKIPSLSSPPLSPCIHIKSKQTVTNSTPLTTSEEFRSFQPIDTE
ncbi:hypothetical protein WA158_008299 [Blastocystis sp. Blastoise]